MAKAYSYIRFSSKKQELGDSLRRQTALAQEYCATHNLTLDTTLNLRDLGVSGFTQENLKKGALGIFLELAQTGKIEQGSILLIEQLDRFSRAEINIALQHFIGLINAGIKVVTLQDGMSYEKDKFNIQEAMYSVMLLSRAHEESLAKSKRLRSAWSAKRSNPPPTFTGECPTWLKVKADKSGYDVIPEIAESIQKVFNLRLAGFGAEAITRKANQEQWPAPTLKGKWHLSTIKRLLSYPQVYGVFQPHTTQDGKRVPIGEPFENYYPVIISKEIFDQAQQITIRNSTGLAGKRRDVGYRNIFQGLLKCSCGASLVFKNKVSKNNPNQKVYGYIRYYCADRVRGVSNCPAYSGDTLEYVLFTGLAMFDRSIISNEAIPKELSIKAVKILNEIAQRKERLTEIQSEIENASSSSVSIKFLITAIDKIEHELQELESEHSLIDNQLKHIHKHDNKKDLFDVTREILNDESKIVERSELRQNMLNLVKKIVVHSNTDNSYSTAEIHSHFEMTKTIFFIRENKLNYKNKEHQDILKIKDLNIRYNEPVLDTDNKPFTDLVSVIYKKPFYLNGTIHSLSIMGYSKTFDSESNEKSELEILEKMFGEYLSHFSIRDATAMTVETSTAEPLLQWHMKNHINFIVDNYYNNVPDDLKDFIEVVKGLISTRADLFQRFEIVIR